MKRWVIFILFVFNGPQEALSIDAASVQKYPYQLLTEDYDILNENDLGAYVWGKNTAPFSDKEGHGGNYWRCYRRDHISITLRDMGSSTEDVGWEDTMADLQITAFEKPNVLHEYDMRRAWTVKIYQKDFNRWRKLMKGEQYVCLGGEFFKREERMQNGEKWQVYLWTFDKIKTKKGCDAYFNTCKLTYREYQRQTALEEARIAKYRQ